MFGFRKNKQDSATTNTTPSHSDEKHGTKPGRRTSSEPVLVTPDDDDFGTSSSSGTRNKHKSKTEDFDNMSMQELEGYAVDQAKETTSSVNNCLKIAEDIRQEGAQTLDTLHKQGEQINRTHMMAVDMERDLTKVKLRTITCCNIWKVALSCSNYNSFAFFHVSVVATSSFYFVFSTTQLKFFRINLGEKLLNNLGGMFAMTWKPKKAHDIKGPRTSKDDNTIKGKGSAHDREKLGLSNGKKGKSASTTPPPESMNAMQQVESEKSKQDDALSDLSNILGDLKGMAVDMGSELDKQNKAIDDLDKDVEELNSRVKGANRRARHIVGK